MSLFLKSQIRCLSGKAISLKSYDCLGFDLDNTISEYNVGELVRMEYEVLTDFLVKRGYDEKKLKAPMIPEFCQRGLLLDFKRGNILKLCKDYRVLKAAHGMKMLSDKTAKEIYNNKIELISNDLGLSKEPAFQRNYRLLSDYFDVPAALAFGRCVEENSDFSNCGQDVIDGLEHIYNKDNYKSGISGYFKLYLENPARYLHHCSQNVKGWLKEMRKTKILFLITGSGPDHANFTASYTLGNDWSSYFDIIICNGRKPGFFKYERQFYKVEELKETENATKPERNKIHCQGNWKQLYKFLIDITGKNQPKCLYFGDNLVEDVYSPLNYSNCDSLAINEELEGGEFRESKLWGSMTGKGTLWADIIDKNAILAVPNLKSFVLNYQ